MNRFDALKSYLARGVTASHCLFCQNDPGLYIVRGTTKEQTINLPFSATRPTKLLITYIQNGHLVLEKSLEDVTIASIDDQLIYYTLSELETLKFKAGEAKVQIKVEFKNGTTTVSDTFDLTISEPLDDRLMSTEDEIYYALECSTNNQKLDVAPYFELVNLSKQLYKCKFYFDSSWNKFDKRAIFKDEYEHTIYADIDESNECYLPDLILEKVGKIYVGLAGTTQSITKPTLWSNAIKVKKGCIEGDLDKVTERFYIYTGVVDDAYSLTDPKELTLLPVNKKQVLAEGITLKDYELTNQYNVVAVPAWMNIECYEMYQGLWGIAPTFHKSSENGNYTFYYYSSKATGKFTSTYKFKEVS